MDENIKGLAEAILALTDQERQELTDLLRSPKPVEKPRRVEETVRGWLVAAGASLSPKGFRYVPVAVALLLELPDGDMMTKVLYPAVAKRFGTTASRVERCIRHEIQGIYQKGKPECLPVKVLVRGEKPTNSEFLTALSLEFREP